MSEESPSNKVVPAMWVVLVVVLAGLPVVGFLCWKRGHSSSDGADVIYLPSNSNPPMEVIANTVSAAANGNLQAVYKVKKGDTLYGISKKFGVSVEAVKNTNKDRDTLLEVGERLVIPARR